jgi:hypothetical protein
MSRGQIVISSQSTLVTAAFYPFPLLTTTELFFTFRKVHVFATSLSTSVYTSLLITDWRIWLTLSDSSLPWLYSSPPFLMRFLFRFLLLLCLCFFHLHFIRSRYHFDHSWMCFPFDWSRTKRVKWWNLKRENKQSHRNEQKHNNNRIATDEKGSRGNKRETRAEEEEAENDILNFAVKRCDVGEMWIKLLKQEKNENKTEMTRSI